MSTSKALKKKLGKGKIDYKGPSPRGQKSHEAKLQKGESKYRNKKSS